MSTGNQIRTQLNKLAEQSIPASSEDLFAKIDLDETEQAAAIYEGKKKKYFELKHQEYWNSVNSEQETIVMDAKQWFDLFAKNFDVSNEAFKLIVQRLCLYFSGHEAFNKTGSLSKGLLLLGEPGTGKSNLMRFFRHNGFQSYRIVSALKITDDYKEFGESAVRPYHNIAVGEKNKFGKNIYGHCIDDIGTEEIPAKHYNQEKNVISEILQFRYDGIDHPCTHGTSNLSLEKLNELYGSRAYDRMKEMFNVITFNNIQSFRK